MNHKKIHSLYQQILDAADVYAISKFEYVEAGFGDITGQKENEVIDFSWVDEVGNPHSVTITESALSEAEIKGGDIWLSDTEGDDFPIRLFNRGRISVETAW